MWILTAYSCDEMLVKFPKEFAVKVQILGFNGTLKDQSLSESSSLRNLSFSYDVVGS